VAIGFTLQAVGQKYAPAADAALILSLESVFAAVGGYFILREGLTPVQFAGAALIFTAITFAQLMQVKKKRTPIPSTQPEIPPDPVP
jgi:drug/metabolite transporter (DMT)-like permease